MVLSRNVEERKQPLVWQLHLVATFNKGSVVARNRPNEVEGLRKKVALCFSSALWSIAFQTKVSLST